MTELTFIESKVKLVFDFTNKRRIVEIYRVCWMYGN